VKKLICLLLCLFAFSACGNEPVVDETPVVDLNPGEIIMPTVIDARLQSVEFIDDAHLMLGYYELTEAYPGISSLIEYDLVESLGTEIYNGTLGTNFFYDVNFRNIDEGLTIQEDGSNDKVLVYDGELKTIPTDPNQSFTTLLSGGGKIVCDDDIIRIYNADGTVGTEIVCNFDLPGGNAMYFPNVIGYAINPQETALTWYGVGDVYVADLQNGEVKQIVPPEIKGIVDFTDINFTPSGEEIVLSSFAENGNTYYQVLDADNGKLVAQMDTTGAEARLLTFDDEKLLLSAGEKFGGTLVAWDYKKGDSQVIYDAATGLYPESYITDVAVSPNGEWLALALYVDEVDHILLIENE